MSSAQVGKTEILLNIIGYFSDQDPSPILLLQPTIEMGEAFSKDRLATMIRDTQCLRNKFPSPKSKNSGNTLLHKVFPGGHITIAGSNSAASLASRPVRIVLCDEVDRYPPSAGTEGDPVSLAKKRSNNFWNRILILTSTPTVRGASRIEMAYGESDQRRYWVPCPNCGVHQVLSWSHVRWVDNDPKTAKYTCAHCASLIEDREKITMLRSGEWRASESANGVAGFHINELYSPWRTWAEVAIDFVAAKKSRETLKAWVNTSLGETWEEDGDQVAASSLWVRREHYKDQVPDGGLIITGGIDVQDDRLEYGVWAWGEGEECWSIDHVILRGDPGRDELWARMGEHISRTYESSDSTMKTSSIMLDTAGHYTQQAYKFSRRMSIVHAMRGVGGQGIPILKRPTRNNNERVPLFSVGVDTTKELLYARLRIGDPGPGYIHFPISDWCDQEYMAQLTAEKAINKVTSGRMTKAWIKTRPRNEIMDLWNMAYAALVLLRPVWSALQRKKEIPQKIESENKPVRTIQNSNWLNPSDNWLRR